MSPTPEIEVAKVAGPFAWTNLVPTLWMIVVSASGGIVSFYGKMKAGEVRAFNVTELIGELFVSAFMGIVTFWICQAFEINLYATAAGGAIAGHMGTRGIFLLEKTISGKLESWANK